MPVAEETKRLRALDYANQLRIGGAEQRRNLKRAPAEVVRAAIVDPTPELGTSRIGTLFAPNGGSGLIYRFRRTALGRAMRHLEAQRPYGRRWHLDVRLDALSRDERVALMDAIAKHAPRSWRSSLGVQGE